MAIEDRRTRERAARRQLITTTARKLAEAGGLGRRHHPPAVRRDRIQPARALQAFLRHGGHRRRRSPSRGSASSATRCLRRAAVRPTADDALARVAHAFIGFAHDNPALFDAMFTRATTLRFAAADTPAELNAAFDELRAAVDLVAGTRDTDTLAEVVWAALHGLVTLDRGGRLRPEYRAARIDLLVTANLARRREPGHSAGTLSHPRAAAVS